MFALRLSVSFRSLRESPRRQSACRPTVIPSAGKTKRCNAGRVPPSMKLSAAAASVGMRPGYIRSRSYIGSMLQAACRCIACVIVIVHFAPRRCMQFTAVAYFPVTTNGVRPTSSARSCVSVRVISLSMPRLLAASFSSQCGLPVDTPFPLVG